MTNVSDESHSRRHAALVNYIFYWNKMREKT